MAYVGEEGEECIAAELANLDDPDMESVGALWQGHDRLQETAAKVVNFLSSLHWPPISQRRGQRHSYVLF